MTDNNKEGCIVCQIIGNSVPSKKIYEDDSILAVLDVNGASPGHCFVIPKNHYSIIEQVPNIEIGNLFQVANKISIAMFDSLRAKGTNIFVANGIPAGQTVAHFLINVMPRSENDGINLQWQPKQLSEEEMSTVELKLREGASKMTLFDSKQDISKPISAPTTISMTSDEEEYISKQMRRLP
jgi:histidine triad (HIT) family protein